MKHSFQLNVNILDNLQWLRNQSELCDVALLTNGHKLFAHSCILASHSPVLAAILQASLAAENDWSVLKPLLIQIGLDDQSDVLDLNCEDAPDYEVLESLVAFMYGEEITVDESQLCKIISWSKILGLSQYFPNSETDEGLFKKEKNRRRKAQHPKRSKIKTHSEEVLELQQFSELNESMDDNVIIEFQESFEDCSMSTKLIKDDKEILNCHLDTDDAERDEESGIVLPSVLHSDGIDEEKSLVINDTESWFANELLNPVEIKLGLHAYAKEKNIKESHMFDLLDHQEMELNHKSNRMSLMCQTCSMAFHRIPELVAHVKSENHYSSICSVCFLKLDVRSQQRMHFLQHDDPLPFFCFSCELRFRSRAGLSMHTPKHSSMKPFSCGECGRAFKWRHAAQAHTVTHSQHRHLLCDVCGFSSKYMSTFKSHLKRHYDQFLPCPHPGCEFKSFRKTHLNDHIATHTKPHSHQCEICGHSFSHAKNLKRHLRLHAPDSSLLRCSAVSKALCKFGTTRIDKLRCHLLKKHDIIPSGKDFLLELACSRKTESGTNSALTVPKAQEATNDDDHAQTGKDLFLDTVLSEKYLNSAESTHMNALLLKSDVSAIQTASESAFETSDYESYLIGDDPSLDTEGGGSFKKQMGQCSHRTNETCNMEQILSSLPVVGSNKTDYESQVMFGNSSAMDDFSITSSPVMVKPEGPESLQLISYIPKAEMDTSPSPINLTLEAAQYHIQFPYEDDERILKKSDKETASTLMTLVSNSSPINVSMATEEKEKESSNGGMGIL